MTNFNTGDKVVLTVPQVVSKTWFTEEEMTEPLTVTICDWNMKNTIEVRSNLGTKQIVLTYHLDLVERNGLKVGSKVYIKTPVGQSNLTLFDDLDSVKILDEFILSVSDEYILARLYDPIEDLYQETFLHFLVVADQCETEKEELDRTFSNQYQKMISAYNQLVFKVVKLFKK